MSLATRTQDLPPGFLPHDGQDCPVDERSTPAVMFRRKAYGMSTNHMMQAGRFHAGYWLNYGRRNCWQWLPDSDEGNDIVAYREG